MNVNIETNRSDSKPDLAIQAMVVSMTLDRREVERLEVLQAGRGIPVYVREVLGLPDLKIGVKTGIAENPEDKSLEDMRITCTFTPEQKQTLDASRSGSPVAEYVRKRMDVQRDPEYMEQILKDQRAPFAGRSPAEAEMEEARLQEV